MFWKAEVGPRILYCIGCWHTFLQEMVIISYSTNLVIAFSLLAGTVYPHDLADLHREKTSRGKGCGKRDGR